jgi:hypothetical protein
MAVERNRVGEKGTVGQLGSVSEEELQAVQGGGIIQDGVNLVGRAIHFALNGGPGQVPQGVTGSLLGSIAPRR